MSVDRPDETPAMMIANDIMAIKVTGRWDDFHEIAQAAIDKAVKAEREACAKVADIAGDEFALSARLGHAAVADKIATSIRART